MIVLPILVTNQRPKRVTLDVKEGSVLRYEIKGERRSWGSDGEKRFLLPASPSEVFSITLRVRAEKRTDTANFTNRIIAFTQGQHNSLAFFESSAREWPTWFDADGVMNFGDLGHRGDLAGSSMRTLGLNLNYVFSIAAEYVLQGRYVYSIPLGGGSIEAEWGLGTDKYVMYRWARSGDHVNIKLTRSNYSPEYGTADYNAAKVFVTGEARLSLNDGLLTNADVSVERGTTVVHLVSRRILS